MEKRMSAYHPPVLYRRVAHAFFEYAVEVLRVLEAQFVGYLGDGLVCAGNQLFGGVDEVVPDVLLGGLAGLFLEQVAEVVGREAHFVGKVFHGGQAFRLRQSALEVGVEQSLKLAQDVSVYGGAGGELAFVEAHAVVQQQLYVSREEAFAQPVGGAGHFPFYLPYAVQEDAFLFLRKVQGFVRLVGEERVRLDFRAQRGAFYQVGVEEQAAACGPCAFLHVHLGHLSRREAHHGAFLVVIRLLAVADVAAAGLFQEEGIHSVIEGEMCGERGGFRQVDHADQRVQGFQSEQFVVFFY